MDDRRNKIIVGSVLAVAVIGVIVLISIWMSGPKCELVEEVPKAPSGKLTNLVAKDNKAIANFNGFLTYELEPDSKTPKKNIMPLNIDSVSVSPLDNNGKLLTVSTDCAKLSISIEQVAGAKATTFAAQSIQVDLKLANGNIKTCQLDPKTTSAISFALNEHYQCAIVKTYTCNFNVKDATGKETIKKVATLTLNNLEFEVDSIDETKIKSKEFSTPARACTTN